MAGERKSKLSRVVQTHLIPDWVVIAAMTVFVVLLILVISQANPGAFEAHFSSYIITPVLGIVANLTLLIMLFRRPTHSRPVLWFALFIICDLIWCSFDVMQRLVLTPSGNAFWGHMIFGVAVFLPALFYLFVREYTHRGRPFTSNIVPILVLGWAILSSAFVGGDNVFPPPLLPDLKAWGYPAPQSILSVWFLGSLSVVTVLAEIRLIAYYATATTRKDRRQAAVLIFGSVFTLSAAGVTAFALPALGIYSLPPLGALANAVLAATVMYTIFKYDMFTVNMSQVADTVLATMTEAVFVTDRNYRVLYANRSADALFAPRGGSIVDRLLGDVASGHISALRSSWESAASSGHIPPSKELTVTANGREHTLEMHVSPAGAAQDGYAFVMNDVSELKSYSEKAVKQTAKLEEANKHLESSQDALMDLLEESRLLQAQLKREKTGVEHKVVEATAQLHSEHARLEASVNSLGVGFIMTDPTGLVLTFNREARTMVSHGVGLKPSQLDQVDNRTLETVVARAFGLRPKIRECLASKEGIKLTNMPLLDRVITVYITPIIDRNAKPERTLGAVILLEDVTDAVALQRSRDEFFSIASHELRTPLTAIRGNSQMIQDYYGSSLKDPQLKGMVEDIHDASIRLITIVNDFLDTSRLEQGKIEFNIAPVNPLVLMHEVIDEIKTAGMNTAVELRIKDPRDKLPMVKADHDRLKQVFINLIGNALKFTEQGSVTVSFTLLPKSVAVLVTDTGKGIPLSSQRLLFRKFQQASDNILTRDSTRSTGLGLYISRLIMTGMGGEIGLERSEPGKGSIFSVIIPFSKVPAKKAPEHVKS